jgi:hypothetical protein
MNTSFVHYEPGVRRLLTGIILITGGTIFLDATPRIIWLTLSNIAGEPLYMKSGLRPAFVLIGVAFLGTLRFRGIPDGVTELLSIFRQPDNYYSFDIVTRRYNTCPVCQSCKRRSITTFVRRMMTALIPAGIFIYGIYLSINSMYFRFLWISGIGGAIWILRNDLTRIMLELFNTGRSDE